MPHRHRHPGVYQEDRVRQRDGGGADDPRSQHPRGELRTGLPDAGALRRGLRDARPRERSDPNRQAPAICHRPCRGARYQRLALARDEERQASRHPRRRAGRSRLRRRARAAWLPGRRVREAAARRGPQHLRHRLLQDEARGEPRRSRDDRAARRAVPLRRDRRHRHHDRRPGT